MKQSVLIFFATLATATGQISAQSLPESITSADKAVPVISQSLSGTWLSELQRPGPAGLLPPIPTFTTFFSEGMFIASPSDGNQTATHGTFLRVSDRKFVGSGYFFSFNEARGLTTVTKLRINYQLDVDGKKLTGTTEAVIMTPDGNVIATLAGATFTMVRLSPEMSADFADFQKLP